MPPESLAPATGSGGLSAYARGLEYLLQTTQALAAVRDAAQLREIVLPAARALVGCDGVTLVVKDGDFCHYLDEDAIQPLWRGQRFPASDCISGWVMRQGEAVRIPDVQADARIPQDLYRPTFVRSLLMAPIGRAPVVGALGCYWAAPHEATDDELRLLQALADSTAIAFASLARQQEQEALIEARTRELLAATQAAEAASRASQEQYRTLFGRMSEGFALGELVRDAGGRALDFRFLEINAAFERLTGLGRDILGRPSLDYLPQREPVWLERYAGVVETGQPLHFQESDAATGRHYDMRVFCPAPGQFAVLFHDITQRVNVEARLRERESYLAQMIDSLPGLIWTTRADGRADFLSSQWLVYTGTALETQLGVGWAATIHPEDRERVQAQWRDVVAARSGHTAEFRVRRHDGEYRWFVARSSPIRADDGELKGWFGICTDIHELKCLQADYEEAKQRYTAFFNNMISGISHYKVITDAQGRPVDLFYEDVNAAYETIVGRQRSDVVGRCLTDVFPGVEKVEPNPIRLYGELALQGGERSFEIYFPLTKQWFSVHAFSHAYGHCTSFFTDISAQKQAEAALRLSEETARSTFEQASVGMIHVSTGGRLLRVNRKFCQMLGYSAEELDQKPLAFITYPLDRDIGVPEFKRMAGGEIASTKLEKRYRHKDGTVIWVRISGAPVRDPHSGQVRYLMGAVEDITERKQSETEREQLLEELRAVAEMSNRNRVQLETFFNQAGVGMAVVHTDGHILRVNRRFCEISGYSEAELMHRTFQSITHPDDLEENLQHNHELMNGQRSSITVEKRYIRKDGQPVWVSATGSLARDDSGRPLFFVRVVVDISTRKLLEQEIMQAHRELESRVVQRTAELMAANEALQKARLAAEEARQAAESANRAKSDFLATMSHEIRTPLNGVIGMTSLLLDSPLDALQRRHAEVIRISGESLLGLINDFLDFSKIESGHLKLEPLSFNLHRIAQETLALVQQKAVRRGLILDCDINAPQWLHGDAARLRQILLNFLSNALKFTEQGTVTLRCWQLTQSGREVWLRFEVKDSGIGIDEDALPRLFQPFTQVDSSMTRRYEGTGLGLAICKRLTDLMGGRIGVRTRLGEGSVFWVDLPFTQLPPEAWPLEEPTPEVRELRSDVGRRRVLLVEDNPVNQMTASAMIKKLGCRVDVVGNGEEAVHALRHVPYDLVLMDCDMPVMDGFEATRHIRASASHISQVPIVAMTANVLAGERERCLAAGMSDYLPKPVRLNDLASMLNKWLSAQQA